MGIDPGFKNGCKIGIIDNNNRILFTGKLNLTTSVNGQDVKLKELLEQYEVGYIALGNGTGCNQVENLICILLTSEPCFLFCLKFFFAKNKKSI